jgi:polysaccharide export outer membrane protein
MRRLPLMFLCALVCTALQACSGSRYDARVFDSRPDLPYTLASGDRLRVIVYGQDALSNSYAVDGTGRIAMPLIGTVDANGLTTGELAHSVENRLRAGFLREPRVSVEVEAYRPFFVLGEVTTAGQFPYINGMTVQNAVAVAGGFTPRAAKWSAELTRTVDNNPITATVPLTQPVRPGDTITIKERLF